MSFLRDVRLWWEDRGWGADQRRCAKVLAIQDRFRPGVEFVKDLAMAAQLDEIQSLPEIGPRLTVMSWDDGDGPWSRVTRGESERPRQKRRLRDFGAVWVVVFLVGFWAGMVFAIAQLTR